MMFPAKNLHLWLGFSMAMLVITRGYTHILFPLFQELQLYPCPIPNGYQLVYQAHSLQLWGRLKCKKILKLILKKISYRASPCMPENIPLYSDCISPLYILHYININRVFLSHFPKTNGFTGGSTNIFGTTQQGCSVLGGPQLTSLVVRGTSRLNPLKNLGF